MLLSYSQHDSERIRNAVEHSLYQIRGFWCSEQNIFWLSHKKLQ